MIPRHTLILAARKSIQIFAVKRSYNAGNVAPLVIRCSRNLVRLLDGLNRQLRGRHHKTLIHKNIRTHRMIDGHERQIIVVIRFPEFRGDSQIVKTVVWNKLVRANLVPLLGGRNASRSGVVDTQAQRGTPWHRILYKTHPPPIKRKKKWTGTFEP